MGASKRLAEMILQALAQTSPKTKFSMVRFGNVLNSSGSVVPKFRQQIKDGGPVTVTDFRMTRYFMTIPEAAQLVIQAGALANGGDVFLLDMGEPVKIVELARRMIVLSGFDVRDELNPDGDIEVVEVGMRPGEKLYEELLIDGNPEKTIHPRIFKSQEGFLLWNQLENKLQELNLALQSNDEEVLLTLLQELISGYQPNRNFV
jgi:FlaA1/EpsC-like NDP-sugar epimerase